MKGRLEAPGQRRAPPGEKGDAYLEVSGDAKKGCPGRCYQCELFPGSGERCTHRTPSIRKTRVYAMDFACMSFKRRPLDLAHGKGKSEPGEKVVHAHAHAHAPVSFGGLE